MAINNFVKRWGVIPPVSARAVPGHPLCPRHGWVFDGGIVDLVRPRADTAIQSQGTGDQWVPGSVRGYAGKVLRHTGVSDQDQLGIADVVLPTGPCTLVMGYRKTDASKRDAVAITDADPNANGGTQVFNLHIFYVDGKFYWQYGGIAEGSTRLSVADGVMAGAVSDPNLFIATVGARGMELWQSHASAPGAILRGSNGANPTRVANGNANPLVIGNGNPNFTRSGDLADFAFVLLYHHQLSIAGIQELSREPFCWVDPRS